jgi:hypothetical protein
MILLIESYFFACLPQGYFPHLKRNFAHACSLVCALNTPNVRYKSLLFFEIYILGIENYQVIDNQIVR